MRKYFDTLSGPRIYLNWIYQFFKVCILVLVVVYVPIRLLYFVEIPAGPESRILYTIRVNTFRRNDLLEQFLNHYDKCPDVTEIQVVWSDQKNSPPKNFLNGLQRKVTFEVHSFDSLSNRFKPIANVETDLVLSIDDDLIVDCETLQHGARVWSSSPKSLVGYSPRLATVDYDIGEALYLRWQHTWWSGFYSIILTKISFLHRDYLRMYNDQVPQKVLDYIDKHRNCEDLAMAYVVAREPTSTRPIWVEGQVWEEAESGISSHKNHFRDRAQCLTMLSMWMAESASRIANDIGMETASDERSNGLNSDEVLSVKTPNQSKKHNLKESRESASVGMIIGRQSVKEWPWEVSSHKSSVIKILDIINLLRSTWAG
jgi:hypothetical protein